MDGEPALWGVIDSLEEGWALIALDDRQRLDWPRERLPQGAREGMAVRLDMQKATEVQDLSGTGTWEGAIGIQAQGQGGLRVQLGDQSLIWPAGGAFSTGDAVVVRMQIDVQSTKRRVRRIKALLDDLFG